MDRENSMSAWHAEPGKPAMLDGERVEVLDVYRGDPRSIIVRQGHPVRFIVGLHVLTRPEDT